MVTNRCLNTLSSLKLKLSFWLKFYVDFNNPVIEYQDVSRCKEKTHEEILCTVFEPAFTPVW